MGKLNILCGFLLAVSFVSVSCRPNDTLKTIPDLEGKDFGHNYPRHGLHLLYWFSHEFISFDNNNNMKPEKDPKGGAFGFHYYGNKENILPSLQNQRGYSYYSVGNLFDNELLMKGERLPDYVTDDLHSSKNLDSRDQNNRDRIIVRRTPFGNIDQVCITQHYSYNQGHGSMYDPNNTYRVSNDLLRDIRNLPLQDFLKIFPPRIRTHYALCHPDRGEIQQDPPNKDCIHKLSGGNTVLPPSFLGRIWFAVYCLILLCS